MKIAKQRGGHTALESARWAAGHYSDERDWTESDEEQQDQQRTNDQHQEREGQKGGRNE